MNKTLSITAIIFAVAVMGFSAVAPMIPQVEANHGEPLPRNACEALENIKALPPELQRVFDEHCQL